MMNVRRMLYSTLLGVGSCVSIGACAQSQSLQTTVQPLQGEDLAQPCDYELTLPDRRQKVLGLTALYDRGPQITSFYADADMLAFAKRHKLALLLAHQCNSKNAPGGPGEMDMDPSHGVGGALFKAIDQFAAQSGHPELSRAGLVLLGFSGTGALFAHFEEYAPARVVAAVLIHPAHYEPVALSRVELTSQGREVPELIFAGGADRIATTQAPYDYFLRFRGQGAPWTFLVQNGADHFEVTTTKPLILAWLEDVVPLREPGIRGQLRRIEERGSWQGYISKCPAERGSPVMWNVCGSEIIASAAASPPPESMSTAGWLPSRRVADLWLAIARQSAPKKP